MRTTLAERMNMNQLAARDRHAEPQGSAGHMQAVAVQVLLEDLQEVTEQRDEWARQCNLTSEREAELRSALALAHESLRWLGRAKMLLGLEDHRGWAELLAVAVACAEQHATGIGAVAGLDDLREVLGWDGPDGPDAVARCLAVLERLELWRDGRLVL